MTKLAILTDHPQPGQRHETPYGLSAPVADYAPMLICGQDSADPRATVRALRDVGTTHLWLCELVASLSPLLEPGDWLVPDDFIDGTRGQHYTYFSEKAGGYIQQVPPFDPPSRDALLRGLAAVTPRPFRRAVYVCLSNTRLETPAEAAFYARAGGHVAGRFLSPWLMLARELEMKTAALACVTRVGGEAGSIAPFDIYLPVLERALTSLEQT